MINKFTIDRTKWMHSCIGVLLDDNDCGCVLGHYCLASGVAPEAIRNKKNISREEGGAEFDYHLIHPDLRPKWMGANSISPSIKAVFIANANDDNAMTIEQKEELLKIKFESLGIQLEFVN